MRTMSGKTAWKLSGKRHCAPPPMSVRGYPSQFQLDQDRRYGCSQLVANDNQKLSVRPQAQATRSSKTIEPRYLAGEHSAWKAGRSEVRMPMPRPVQTRKKMRMARALGPSEPPWICESGGGSVQVIRENFDRSSLYDFAPTIVSGRRLTAPPVRANTQPRIMALRRPRRSP